MVLRSYNKNGLKKLKYGLIKQKAWSDLSKRRWGGEPGTCLLVCCVVLCFLRWRPIRQKGWPISSRRFPRKLSPTNQHPSHSPHLMSLTNQQRPLSRLDQSAVFIAKTWKFANQSDTSTASHRQLRWCHNISLKSVAMLISTSKY